MFVRLVRALAMSVELPLFSLYAMKMALPTNDILMSQTSTILLQKATREEKDVKGNFNFAADLGRTCCGLSERIKNSRARLNIFTYGADEIPLHYRNFFFSPPNKKNNRSLGQ